MSHVLAILALCLAVSGAAAAHAQTLTGFGGVAGLGANVIAPDDEGSVAIDLTPGFPEGVSFYGRTFSSLHVNTNGTVSFGASTPDYVPSRYPCRAPRCSAGAPTIAVWHADVDTRGTVGPTPAGQNRIHWHLADGLLVVTWYLVGHYDRRVDARLTAQIVLRRLGPAESNLVDIELRYGECGWQQGDDRPSAVSLPAQVGIDLGDGRFAMLRHDLAGHTLEAVCSGTNTTPPMPGVWRFRSDALPAAVCGNERLETGEECDFGPDARLCPGCSFRPPPDAGPPALYDASRPDAGISGDGGSSGTDAGGAGNDGGSGGLRDGGLGSVSDGGSGMPPGDEPLDVFGGGCTARGRARSGLAEVAVVLAALLCRAQRRSAVAGSGTVRAQRLERPQAAGEDRSPCCSSARSRNT